MQTSARQEAERLTVQGWVQDGSVNDANDAADVAVHFFEEQS